jgi:hypothetical protein
VSCALPQSQKAIGARIYTYTLLTSWMVVAHVFEAAAAACATRVSPKDLLPAAEDKQRFIFLQLLT